MAREIKQYDHLNNPEYSQGEMVQKIPLDEVAKKLLKMNYGLWRFMSALDRIINDPENADLKRTWGKDVEAIVNAYKNLPHSL